MELSLNLLDWKINEKYIHKKIWENCKNSASVESINHIQNGHHQQKKFKQQVQTYLTIPVIKNLLICPSDFAIFCYS